MDGEVARYACAGEVDSGTYERIECGVCHLDIGWLLALASRSSSAESIGWSEGVRGMARGHETRGQETRAR